MGLIKASIVSAIVYYVWQFLFVNYFSYRIPEAMRCKVSPWIPIITIFLIELLL